MRKTEVFIKIEQKREALADLLAMDLKELKRLKDSKFSWNGIVYDVRTEREINWRKGTIAPFHFAKFIYKGNIFYVRELSKRVLKKYAINPS